ncbi:ABC transporter permease [Streptomyces sp. UNOB3_S3]|uniref:ABC transporter permease n=1 Tax=Streptomyces sp. UNOB3_S3 TaxID=2871682 RepID=UPI0027E35FE9|nr:ABC transporter permease [Streptomyces sp. UNOB3_S3]
MPGRPRPTGPTGLAAWARDLAMGARFAVTGGRESLLRTALVAIGVGLGVALLAIAASVPHLSAAREHRENARSVNDQPGAGRSIVASDRTLLYQAVTTDFHDKPLEGALLQPEGPRAPLPPGVAALPAPGEMVVSPALRDLLRSADGELLRERLPHRIAGVIGDEGVMGPDELFYYAGSDRLRLDALHGPGIHDAPARIDRFGHEEGGDPVSPVLVVLMNMTCVVLLLPIGIFIATAVRAGGERRDRRLAALRLVGTDIRATRRIASGEALCGALLGLGVGAAVFLIIRRFASGITIRDVAISPADLVPSPALAALIAVAVPAVAVLVTLVTLRRVTIEPLGVMRDTTPRRRRLWWRLLFPAAGLALLIPLFGGVTMDPYAEDFSTYQVAGGGILVLVGIAALLPWLLEACVARFRGGPVSWQLATRRIESHPGPAARAVGGITVAMAGAIAVQMLFAGVQGEFVEDLPTHSQMMGVYRASTPAEARSYTNSFRATPGVRDALVTVDQFARKRDGAASSVTGVTVGDCDTLRRLAKLDSCRDGDVFVADEPGDEPGRSAQFPPGTGLFMEDWPHERGGRKARTYEWTIPSSARIVQAVKDPMGRYHQGVLATPSAIDVKALPEPTTEAAIQLEPGNTDAIERVRNTAAAIDPLFRVHRMGGIQKDSNYATIQRALLIGTGLLLALIGAGLTATTMEQLRERRRLMSTLAALGARRRSVAGSVLWQTAIPVVLGTALAVAGGLGLGWVMLRVVNGTVRDWLGFLPVVGVGVGMIALVTALSLPAVHRTTRPNGLRTE